ncbi:PHB depolymerase family esterase, partial [Massilia arenosa]
RQHGRGSFTGAVFSCGEGQRRYKLYVPPGPARAPRPLLVLLHGCTQNADDFATGTAMNGLADEQDCLVLYPEQDRGANPNGCWNWFDPAHQARAGEPALIAALTRQVMAEQDADPARVYVAGLSAGGAMAAVLGAAYPELYAGVGVHSGLPAGSGRDMISGLQAMKRPGHTARLRQAVPIIVFHGDADSVVHPDNGQTVLRQFIAPHGPHALTETRTREEATGHACTRARWHTAAGELVAEHWLVHGAAHAWQGGDPAGSHASAAGPSATRAMLAFFLHRHAEVTQPA